MIRLDPGPNPRRIFHQQDACRILHRLRVVSDGEMEPEIGVLRQAELAWWKPKIKRTGRVTASDELKLRMALAELNLLQKVLNDFAARVFGNLN